MPLSLVLVRDDAPLICSATGVGELGSVARRSARRLARAARHCRLRRETEESAVPQGDACL